MALGRGVRWLLAGLAGIVVLVAAAALLLPHLIDVQRFAPIVSAQLKQITGREVTLGTIALRVLPVPAVTITPVTIGEGPRYPGRQAVQLRSLQVRLRPLPLLAGRLVLSSVILDRPTVTIIRDSQGRWSFDDLVGRASAAEKAEAAGGTARPAAGPSLGVASAVIRGGRVLIYDDAVIPGTRSQATVGPIDASLEGWGLGGRTTIDMTVGLGESRMAAKASLESGDAGPKSLAVELPGSRLRATDLRPLFPWLGVASTGGLEIGGSLGVKGKAHVPLSGVEAVAFEGTVDVEEMRFKDASLARPIEKIGGRLAVNGARATWEGFTASLGPSEVHGRLEVQDYLHPRIGFALESKHLDLNELVAAFPTGPSVGGAPGTKGRHDEPGDTVLRQITARGTLAVEALRVQTFDLTNVRGTATLRDGVLGLADAGAKLYGGTLSGGAGLDLAHGAARWRLDSTVTGLDVDALATAYDRGLKNVLRGRLTGRIGIEAVGDGIDAILGTAHGNARVAINDGAIASISVLKQLAALLEMAGGKGVGREETPFQSLSGTFAIGDRRATTSDLALDSADLDLEGRGDVGLDTALDLAVTARFSESASRGMVETTPALKSLTAGDGRLTVHLLATGTLAAPKIGLDTHAQMRQVQEHQKEKVKEKVRGRLLDLLGGKPQETTPPQEPPPQKPPRS
jgi:AsmA protein